MQPIFKMVADDQDITGVLASRFVELSIKDSSGFDSDTLDITLNNSGAGIARPRRGVHLQCWIGFKSPNGQEQLYYKGAYYVDELSESGAPDQLRINAKSADMLSDGKTLRTQAYANTTLGSVLELIAARNYWQLAVATVYRGVPINWLLQQDESDLAFLTRLGHLYGAVGTIKSSRLVFVPQGALLSQSGQPMPQITVNLYDCSSWDYQELGRGEYAGATANWRDNEGGGGVVTRGSNPVWTLRELFDSESRAGEAADAELRRLAGGSNTLSLTLDHADPALSAESEILARGFRSYIDAQRWVAKNITLTLGAGGFSGTVDCERYV